MFATKDDKDDKKKFFRPTNMRANILTYSDWWDTLCSVNNWYCKLDSSDNGIKYLNILLYFLSS